MPDVCVWLVPTVVDCDTACDVEFVVVCVTDCEAVVDAPVVTTREPPDDDELVDDWLEPLLDDAPLCTASPVPTVWPSEPLSSRTDPPTVSVCDAFALDV